MKGGRPPLNESSGEGPGRGTAGRRGRALRPTAHGRIAVERHVTNIFRKLREFDRERFDPRVVAVIAYLDSFGSLPNAQK